MVVLSSSPGTHGNPNQNNPTPTRSSKSKQTQDPTAPQGLSSSVFSTSSIHSMPCVHSDTLWHHIQVPHTARRRLDASLCQGARRGWAHMSTGQWGSSGPQEDGSEAKFPGRWGQEEGQDQPWDRMGMQGVDEEGDPRNSTKEWEVKLGRVESPGRVLSSWSPLWATALRPPGNSESQSGACLRVSRPMEREVD